MDLECLLYFTTQELLQYRSLTTKYIIFNLSPFSIYRNRNIIRKTAVGRLENVCGSCTIQ